MIDCLRQEVNVNVYVDFLDQGILVFHYISNSIPGQQSVACSGGIDCSKDSCLLNSCLGFLSTKLTKSLIHRDMRQATTNCSKADEIWCMKTLSCMAKDDCKKKIAEACPEGTDFCGLHWGCQDVKMQEAIYLVDKTVCKEENCEKGEKFLPDEMQCKEVKGEKSCLQTGKCEKEGDNNEDRGTKEEDGCPPGYHLCLSSGTCQPNKEELFGFQDKFDNFEEQSCPAGQSYCFEIGQCSVFCGVQVGEAPGKEGENPSFIQCSAGEIYCIGQKRCVADCRNDDRKEGINEGEEEEELYTEIKSCPPGMVFCLATQTCVFDGNEDDFIIRDIFPEDVDVAGVLEKKVNDDFECPFGTVYCLSVGDCVEACGDLQDGRTLEEKDLAGTWAHCPPGQVYCVAVQACVSDCSFFADPEEGDARNGCPLGMVSLSNSTFRYFITLYLLISLDPITLLLVFVRQ